MAFTASTVWEVQTGGNDTNNGGGFDTGVAGFPTDGAATSANTSAPVFTSASYSFVAGDVAAWIYIKSGTNWTPGWYVIDSVSAGAATLNGTIGLAVLAGGVLSAVVGCATVASPTGATWGIDYSQQAASEISFTDMVIGAVDTATFTSALNPVAVNFIGNVISVTAGTGFTVQRVAVVSTSGTVATVDKSLGTAGSTGGTGQFGGALASPGLAGSLHVATNTTYIKAGTYTISSSSPNVAGGRVNLSVAGTWEGYNSTRGDLGTRPVVEAGLITNITLITSSSADLSIRNISSNGLSGFNNRGFQITGCGYLLVATNCPNRGINGSGAFIACRATACGGIGIVGGTVISCEAYANTGAGIGNAGDNTDTIVDCLSYGNTGASSDGFQFSAGTNQAYFANCTAYNNGRDGFRVIDPGSAMFVNCIAEANSGYGFSGAGVNRPATILVNCAGFNNTSGNVETNLNSHNRSFAIGTNSFFTGAAENDFSLNNANGGGASARAAGYPGLFPRGTTTGYRDIGSVQHADPSVARHLVIHAL